MITEEALISYFEKMGALLTGHFVLTSRPEGSPYRRHSGAYVNKDIVSSHPGGVCKISDDFVKGIGWFDQLIDVVAAPAIGAIVFGAMVARHIGDRTRFVYAEAEDDKMVFKRGFDKLIGPGKHVVIVEDIVTSGSTLKKMIEAVRSLGGEIVAVVILWQRGAVDLDGVNTIALVDKEYPVQIAEECDLCKQRIPISTEVGHGKEFLAEFGEDSDNWPANRTSA